MASATSKVSVVTTGTSVRNRRKSYYVTDVTTLADGSMQRQTYRSDSSGNNKVLIQTVKADGSGKIVSDVVSSGASAQEKKSLANPNSSLRKSIRDQTKDAGETALRNEEQAAAGGLTDVGKKNLDVVGGGSGNKASDEQSGDTQPIASADTTKAAAGTRNSFGDQVFPEDLAESGMDVIKFTMLEFKPRNIGDGPGGFGRIEKRVKPGEQGRKGIGTVMLPVPGGITDQNNADWGDGRINPLQAAGLDVAGKALAGGLEAGTAAAVKQFTDLGGENATATKDLLKGAFSAAAVGLDPNEVLARTQGAVINPNLELLFKGPTLRPFNFTFQMGARNSDESDLIMEILRFFKQGSAPQRTQAQMLIKAPHTFQIEYLHRGKNNKYLNLIKECALLSVGVNYTPNNNYATFANGAPVSIELTLGFKELDPVFNDDYQGEGVGF